MKKNILILSCLLYVNVALSQSLALRPYAGFKKFGMGQNSAANNFDPSFNTKNAFTNHSVGIALEYNRKAISYELCFTAQAGLFSYSFYLEDAGVRAGYKTNFGFNQIQGICNYSLLKFDNPDKTYNITPIVSAGIGFGFVDPQNYFDKDRHIEHFVSQTDPNEFFDINFTTKRRHKISLSSILKLGLMLHSHTKEVFRLQLIANIGLNEAVISDLVYYHTSKKYTATLNSYGSHIGILASVPICIKRFKRK